MQSDKDLQQMIKVVEDYIFERKGVRVRIVFNNMARFPVHFDMLLKAHEFILSYKNTKK